MSSKSKQKGYRLEADVVRRLKEAGINAERIPLSGSMGGKYSSDVVIGTPDDPHVRIECKNRESLPEYLWRLLGPVDWLVLKKNNHPALALIRFDDLIRLLTKALQSEQG
jgi:hypothetical protein